MISEASTLADGVGEMEILSEETHPITKEHRVRIKSVLQTLDEQNKNKRIYPKALYETALMTLMPEIQGNRVVGELDHPLMTGVSEADASRHFIVLYSKASHLFKEVHIEGNKVIGTVETLLTPHGQTLAGIIRSGVPVGFSVRAVGQTRPCGSGITEITAPFQLISWDAVSNPSHASARMTEICAENSKGLKEAVEFHAGSDDQVLYERFDILNSIYQEIQNPPKSRMSILEGLVDKLDNRIKNGKDTQVAGKELVGKMVETYVDASDDKKLDSSLVGFLSDHILGKDPITEAFKKHFR